MSLEMVVAAVMLLALVLYVVGGGADFGGGLWDLLASGPRQREQRALVEASIGPVWEANHVWFIFVFVLLFTGFPGAFSRMTTAFFGPLTLFAFGVVVRGAAFVFRHYDPDGAAARRRVWSVLFGGASVLCPFLLGTLGAAMLRDRPIDAPLTTPFPVAAGAFTVCLTAALAAVYLAVAARSPTLASDFRARAKVTTLLAGGLAAVTLVLARDEAPALVGWVVGPAVPFGLTTALGLATVACLQLRRDRAARVSIVTLVTTVVACWGAAKLATRGPDGRGPLLVWPDVTFAGAKAHDATLTALLVATALGGVLLVPSLVLLLRTFAAPREDK